METEPDEEMPGRPDAHARHRTRSLRAQLVLIPAAMLILGLLGTVGIVLLEAQNRIAAEIASGLALGRDLATNALHNQTAADTPSSAFERLRQSLPHVRHVRFELVPATTILSDGARSRAMTPMPRSWLAMLLAPPPQQQIFPVVIRQATVGEVRLLSDPADEIAEIIGEVALFTGALVALGLLLVGGLLWAAHRALRPVQVLADGLDRLERGEYRPIAPIAVAEFHRIAHQFNLLVRSLQRVTSDNHFLIGKLLSMQEEERKALASDLHDEFGPVLFGIRAEAACIIKSVPDGSDQSERAHSISALADGMQKLNYRILDRLRPLVLEQMGLSQALREQVEAWQRAYPDIRWSLVVAPYFADPAEAQSLVLYRAAQEGAINAVRHARASAIDIRLERQWCGDAIAPGVTASMSLSVHDDGNGLPSEFRRGFGLLGLAERVRQLGGTLAIRNMHPGTSMEVSLLEDMQRTMAEPFDADFAD